MNNLRPNQEPEEEPRATSNYGIPMYKVPIEIARAERVSPAPYEEFLHFPEATIEEFFERVKREEGNQGSDRL